MGVGGLPQGSRRFPCWVTSLGHQDRGRAANVGEVLPHPVSHCGQACLRPWASGLECSNGAGCPFVRNACEQGLRWTGRWGLCSGSQGDPGVLR